MEAALIALVVPALGGITYLAYKHPRGYSRFAYPALAIVMLSAAVFVAAWDFALVRAGGALLRELKPLASSEALSVIASLRFPDWTLFALLGVSGYWSLLTLLPRLTEDGDDKGEK